MQRYEIFMRSANYMEKKTRKKARLNRRLVPNAHSAQYTVFSGVPQKAEIRHYYIYNIYIIYIVKFFFTFFTLAIPCSPENCILCAVRILDFLLHKLWSNYSIVCWTKGECNYSPTWGAIYSASCLAYTKEICVFFWYSAHLFVSLPQQKPNEWWKQS